MRLEKISIFTIITVLAIGAVLSTAHADELTSMLPPAKQVKAGVSPEDVTCKGVQVLLLKTDGSPICLNPATAEQFVLLGIATVVERGEGADGMMIEESKEVSGSEPLVSMTVFSDRFAVMKDKVQLLVDEAVALYETDSEAALDAIVNDAYDENDPYLFVLDFETVVVKVHQSIPDMAGTDVAYILENSGKTIDEIKKQLTSEGNTWLMYTFTNPATGYEQTKKSYMALNDGLVFGSGFYLNDLEAEMIRAMWVADSAVKLYDEHGTVAFDMINDDAANYTPGDLYPFAAHINTTLLVAHGADANRVGDVSVVADSRTSKPMSQVQAESALNGGTWDTYTFVNFETGKESAKLSWLIVRGDYVFGAGFYPDAKQLQKINAMMSTDHALLLYATYGEDAFEKITALNIDGEHYPYVMEFSTALEVADGSILDRRGQIIWTEYERNAVYNDIIDDLKAGYPGFATSVFLNQATGQPEAKTGWTVLYDGYIFGAGFHPQGEKADILEAKYSADVAVEMYKLLGADEAFDIINMMNSISPSYPAILDLEFNVEAHGADASLVGLNTFDLIMMPDKDADQIMSELQDDGDKTWVRYVFEHPATGEPREKAALLELYDEHIFLAGYYPDDLMVDAAAVEFTVREQAWLDSHPHISVAYDPLWPPYEYADENKMYAGVSAALAKQLSSISGSEFVQSDGIESWGDALLQMQDGTADVLLMVENTPERDTYMDFTEPWIILPIEMVVMGYKEIALDNLAQNNVVTVKDYAIEAWLDQNMSDVDYISVPTVLDALNMLADGTADVYLDSLLSARYLGSQHGIMGLSSAGYVGDNYDISIAYTQGDGTLGSILQKMLDAIPQGEIDNMIKSATSE